MKYLHFPEGIRWVASARQEGFPIETSYFKTVFNLANTPRKSNIQISANTRYILYVNGIEIIHGPCRGDYWHHFCDVVNIAPYLKSGTNVMAVKVTAYPPLENAYDDFSNRGPEWAMTKNIGPMLFVHGELDNIDVSTGRADWYYLNDNAISWNFDAFTQWMGCTERVDGNLLPKNWQLDTQISNDFSLVLPKWDNSVRFGEITPLFLHNRPIKNLLREEINDLSVLSGFPFPLDGEISLPPNSSFEAILSVERMTTAFIYLNCSGGAGSKINLLYSEAFYKHNGERYFKEDRCDTSGELRGVSDIYYPGGGDEIYSPSWFRSFRFIKVTIETADEPLILRPLKIVETRYPLVDRVKFSTNEPWVQQVWDISLRTLELCMHETYEDCPYYEQLQYTMDTRLHMLFTYIISNDTSMQLRTIHDYHTSQVPEGMLQSRFPSNYPQIIPVFALHWILMLKDYYMETGDAELLERYRPTMEGVLAWFRRKTGKQGLIEYLGYWDFADWTDAWDDIDGMPRATLHGPSTIQNLVYAYVLEESSWIMDALDYKVLADKYRTEKIAILRNVDALCWSDERGIYREGPNFEEYSQHAQLWAVLSELATGEKAKSMLKIALADSSLVPCSFVLQFYLFRALEKAGMYEETGNLWNAWKNLIDMNCTTVPEIPGKYTRSECHAWGSLILHELPRKFLGITPLKPGYEELQIKPICFYINEIIGSVPTPHGDVSVKWSNNNDKFEIEGSTPVPALVILPDGTEHHVEAGKFSFP